jgi:hypothetical protein
LCPENSVQGISSSSEVLPTPALTPEVIDDDDSSSKKTEHSTVRDCLTAFVQASGIKLPMGKMPESEIASGLEEIGATVGDLVRFLKEYARHWRDAPFNVEACPGVVPTVGSRS